MPSSRYYRFKTADEKERKRKLKTTLFWSVFTVAFLTIIWLFFISPFFKITQIQLPESDIVTKEDISGLIAANLPLKIGENILLFSSGRLKAALAITFPTITNLKIRKKLFHTIVIGFEKRVQENLLKVCGGLPIISVSQKPIDLGVNICVGNVGASGFNMFHQVQIACKTASTPFVISAEADCLYPPDYFKFIPPRLDACYRDSNLYVMPDRRDYFFYKREGATHAQIVGRKFYLQVLAKLFKGAPKWSLKELNFPKERWGKKDVFDKIHYWKTKNPVFQIKTHKGMRYYTHSDRTPILTLPYWGQGQKTRRYYLHGIN